jgi:hypothetical protein
MSDQPKSEFERAADRGAAAGGMLGEFRQFLRHNRKWWLIPILVVLLLFGVLMVLAATGAAPFIYTLF